MRSYGPVSSRSEDERDCVAYHTTPYAPSPTTSWMSYCSETLKEIFLELPLPAGGMVARDGLAELLLGRGQLVW